MYPTHPPPSGAYLCMHAAVIFATLHYIEFLKATATHALAGAQHSSKAKSWKLNCADPLGMPHTTPLHPASPSLGQGRLRAKSGSAPTAIIKTGTPSGFDNPAGWTSDHPDPGSVQASTARRRSESSQARMRKVVHLHTDQEPGASPVGSSRLHTKVSCPHFEPVQLVWPCCSLVQVLVDGPGWVFTQTTGCVLKCNASQLYIYMCVYMAPYPFCVNPKPFLCEPYKWHSLQDG